MADTLVSPPPVPPPAPVIDCAAYCGGARVADLGIDQIRPALARDDQFVWLGLYEPEQDVLRQVQQQFGLHDLADRRRLQRASAAEARALRGFGVRRAADGAHVHLVAPAGVRRDAHLPRPQLSRHRPSRLAALAHRRAAALRVDAASAVEGARLRPVRADGLRRRSVSAGRAADRGGGRGSRGRDLRQGRHRRRDVADLSAQARSAVTAPRGRRRSSRSAIA